MEETARVVLGLLFLALVINLIQRGPGGVKDWLAAKFLGQAPSVAPAPARSRR